MKLWLSTSEIAVLALPGMPASARNVIKLAEREAWAEQTAHARPRDGRGGGTEYHINLLPPEARMAYVARFAASDITEAGAEEAQGAPDIATSTGQASLALDARLHIVGSFRALSRRSELTHSTALVWFVDLYNAGRIDAPAWVRAAVPHLSARTLQRWLSSLGQGEVGRLAVDRGAARRGSSVLERPEIKPYALALVAQNPHYSGRHIHEALTGRFPAVQIPSIRAVERALKGWKAEHATELMALTNPDKFVSTTRVAGSYAHTVSRLNELWQIDASPADVLTSDGRHAIYVCIDVWSRRMLVLVTKTARSEAVQLLLRAAILAWGVPERIKTDNGSDFIARATKRLFAALGIEVETSTAFSPWQKGVVERAIGTFQRDFCTTLPGFIGHSVADRKVIEQRKAFAQRLGQDDARAFAVGISATDLQREADTWCTMVYAHRAHGGIGKQTPFERAATFTGRLREVAPDALHVLLMPVPGGDGTRTVGKMGVRLDGFHYLCPGIVVGTRVFVRLDPADAGRAYLFDPEGVTFIGVARCPDLSGEDRAALVAEVQATQKRLISERTADIRREAKGIDARTVLDHRNRQALERVGKLVAMPRPRAVHVTAQITAAIEAAGQAPAPSDTTRRVPNEALQAEVVAEMASGWTPRAPGRVTKLRTTETPSQRFRRARALEEQLAAGAALATGDAVWLGGYQASAEYRAQRTMFEDFGEAALR